MTDRTFQHQITDARGRTKSNPSLGLSPAEIAIAAMQEVSQLSLNATPFSMFVDELLAAGTKRFTWLAELGQVRETRTALSGLFGRFVARAYLTRYHGFCYFEPIRSSTQPLSGWPSLHVRKKRGVTGDLPDWVVSTSTSPLTIAVAEAKGSHNTAGPFSALRAAKTQVRRIEIVSGKTTLRVKRYAVATRWAVHGNAKLSQPWLVVDDPEEGERAASPNESRRLARSIALGHFAQMAKGFGLTSTAAALQEAKIKEPGLLEVPEEETLRVESAHTQTDMIGAIVASTGLLRVPSGERHRRVSDRRTLGVWGSVPLLWS